VNQSSFTIGVVPLPGSDRPALSRAIAAMREGMARNIGGTERSSKQLATPVLAAAGAAPSAGAATDSAPEPTDAVEVEGRIEGKSAKMHARYVAHHERAYQVVAVGVDLDPDQARAFLESFKLND
jgi:hypothetical protein